MKELPAERGVNVRDEFMKFHEKYYSANVMKLVVLGRESLDELQNWVLELFNGVKNKDLPDPAFEGQPFGDEQLMVCYMVHIYWLALTNGRHKSLLNRSWIQDLWT